MANYATIQDNVVTNIIFAATKDDAELATKMLCVEYNEQDYVKIGDIYDSINDVFTTLEEEPTE